jgi:hypothetical protein
MGAEKSSCQKRGKAEGEAGAARTGGEEESTSQGRINNRPTASERNRVGI